MGALSDEYREWNTPVVGAYLLWRFTKGFMSERSGAEPPSFLWHCVAAAIVSSATYSDVIDHARSLHKYSQYFIANGMADKLEKLHYRVQKLLPYTKRAVDIAVNRHMLVWDVQNGALLPVDLGSQAKGSAQLSSSIKDLGRKADRLGQWCSKVDLNALTIELGVKF